MKINFEVPPVANTDPSGLAVRYAAAKRSVPRWRWRAAMLLLAVVPVYLLVRLLVAYLWQSAPAVVIPQTTVIRAGFNGIVTALVQGGEVLAQGQALAQITPAARPAPPAASPLPAPAADHGEQTRQAALSAVRSKQLAVQRALSGARAQQRVLQERQRAMEALRRADAATRQEVEAAQLAALRAGAEVAQVERDLADVQRETQLLQVVPPKPEAAAATADAVPAREPPRTVPMPFSGRVARTHVVTGEWVDASTELATLVSDAPAMVHAYVPAANLPYGLVGTPAMLKFRDGTELAAAVQGVQALAERPPSDQVSPLVPRNLSVVLVLKPSEPLPERYRIMQLPLEVHFQPKFELRRLLRTLID